MVSISRKIEHSDKQVYLADNSEMKVIAKGLVNLNMNNGKLDRVISFSITPWVPDLRTKLTSIAKTTNNGY